MAGDFDKPVPAELFTRHGASAEMRWEAMSGKGRHTPNDRFFVRNHTRTPRIDPASWRLQLHGTGLRGSPTLEHPVEFGYDDLRTLPAVELSALLECTGNGRAFFASQQQQHVPGTPWGLGAVGAAAWRGVRLRTVLTAAGITEQAVDVLPRGLDDEFVEHGVDHGRVRRPLPVAKAMDDVIVAYEMNGEPLPPDHGFPARLVVPNWVGIASIKWLGDIQVADEPLTSPWNTVFYNLDGVPLTRLVVKSAFELPWNAELGAGRTHRLRGRSWSGNGRIEQVALSTDSGRTWTSVDELVHDGPWARWTCTWSPESPGLHHLLACATDSEGNTQPAHTTYNTMGYLFGAVVHHPVTVL